MASRKNILRRRALRVRRHIKQGEGGRLRLSVYRSNQNIYAQIIDDRLGHTVASASTLESPLRESLKGRSDCEAARAVGKLIGERAVAASLGPVVFDRGPYIYHGRVKALADAAREAGMSF